MTRSPGLSPRVRGNRPAVGLVFFVFGSIPARAEDRAIIADPPFVEGSIPARAGEPRTAWMARKHPWVYPRACGGTARGAPASSASRGLSPRVRGNPGAVQVGPRRLGSIPARAGEPAARAGRCSRGRVYPRACGGTGKRSISCSRALGLSPRVRGNPMAPKRCAISDGSIPARAGEPL